MKFEENDTQVLGISTNAKPVQNAFAQCLGTVPYPILSDLYPHGSVAKAYGVFNEDTGAARRAVIIVDKNGIVQWRRIYTRSTEMDVGEVLSEVNKL